MTIADVWPGHLLTLDEWDTLTLPEDLSVRAELVEGVLVLSPASRFLHQSVLGGIVAQLNAAADGRWRALPKADVVVEGGPTPTVRRPDVVVVPKELVRDRSRCDGSEALAVFEVLSPGTMRIDRVLKMYEYAQAGIPFYGLVDAAEPVTMTEFRLVGEHYERVAEHRGRAELGLGVAVDLDAL